jgi:hypothetical protein
MTASGTLGSPRAGVKNQIEEIIQKLQDHDEALSRVDASIEKNAVSLGKISIYSFLLSVQLLTISSQFSPNYFSTNVLESCGRLIKGRPGLVKGLSCFLERRNESKTPGYDY